MLAAQRGQFDPFGPEFRLQLGAQPARLVEVALQFRQLLLSLPLVARPRPDQVGDPAPGDPVPVTHQHRTGNGCRRSGCDQAAEHQRIREQPGADGTQERSTRYGRGLQNPVQGWGMAVASTWHGANLPCLRPEGMTAPGFVPQRLPPFSRTPLVNQTFGSFGQSFATSPCFACPAAKHSGQLHVTSASGRVIHGLMSIHRLR